ncbi:hypothetical protein BN946_scf184970.g47 [Trametes cinnabarina]|uniref:Uncharacterized protein n=1 Tax=Pycnoporus cinnabarinus TaxID=5643 RepID=A0A060SCV4_PYCCI|nr:hypothetical protein BN946_scf184970.g47 [Trametes cinnabarina]
MDVDNQSLVVAYELDLNSDAAVCEANLLYLGQWTVDGPWNSIGLRAEHDHSLTLFHSDPAGCLVTRSIRINDPPPSPDRFPESHSSNHLPLPNPFKALKALSTENVPETDTEAVPDRVEVGAQIDHGEIGLTEPVRGLRAHDGDTDVHLCAWSADELLVSVWHDGILERRPVLPLSDVHDIRWIDHESFSTLFSDRVVVYRVASSSDATEQDEGLQPKVAQTIVLSSYDVAALTLGGHVVSTRVKNGRRRIHHTSVDASDSVAGRVTTRSLWKAQSDAFAPKPEPRISCILPLELDLIILGYTDGSLRRSSFKDTTRCEMDASQLSDLSLPGAILALDVIQISRSAERLLVGGADDGTIAIWSLESVSGASGHSRAPLSSTSHASPDAASTILLDIPVLLRQLSGSPALAGTSASPSDLKTKLEHARSLLAALLTFGISEGVDTICSEDLGIRAAKATLGVASPDTLTIVPQPSPQSVWTLSPEASADRVLAILSLMHFLTQFEGMHILVYDVHTSDGLSLDLAQDATTVITFYAASIGQLVADYQPPSLTRLAHHLLRVQATEMRHAVRLLTETGVARLSDTEANEVVEAWQRFLPSTKPERERNETRCAEALCVCGFIAVDKYSLLATSTLIDIAKSIAAYLHDETSPYRSLAIDLCSRGFQIWQQYVDAVEMLRALFMLATTSKKEAISVPNIGVQARSAVLQIAASNTPLFMTTLVLDILHPRNVQHRKSVMQLVIFLIRKKPLVLYSNLPRLVEAIVKSLDPNSSASRDAILDSATEILSHIVQTFPTVDFHMGSQRLAVGTSEGAVVMYDLKTATRLYVLEGHKKRTTACSFSPDGRRLVTLSLEESVVLVWKVGSSFTSFFLPGAPPRQGHSGTEPYKTLNFNIGDCGECSALEPPSSQLTA